MFDKKTLFVHQQKTTRIRQKFRAKNTQNILKRSRNFLPQLTTDLRMTQRWTASEVLSFDAQWGEWARADASVE